MVGVVQDFLPVGFPTRPGTRIVLRFLTIHNTDNPNRGAGAAAHNRYIRGAQAVAREVSWHYTVDDRAIFQHLPDNEKGFHASTRAGNESSIGIEICMNSDMNAAVGYANAAELVAALIVKHGLPFPASMKQHGSWTAKNCPSVLRAGAVLSWDRFLAQCEHQIAELRSKRLPPDDLFAIEQTDAKARIDWDSEEARAVLQSIDSALQGHGGERDE